MASHGRRGIAALLLGSKTVKVLTHSKIPVLVHRWPPIPTKHALVAGSAPLRSSGCGGSSGPPQSPSLWRCRTWPVKDPS